MKNLSKLFFLFLILTSLLPLTAKNSSEWLINNKEFVKDIQGILTSDDGELLVKKAAIHLKEKEQAHIPNCFDCSLFLIQSTLSASPSVQLVAGDLAVKFSPDLPEAHLHFFLRLLKFAPFKVVKIAKEAKETIKTFYNFPTRSAFFYVILNILYSVFFTFISIFFLIMALKYPSLIAHRFMHLAGHSRFYAMSLLLVLGFSSWVLLQGRHGVLLIMLVFLVFLSGVAVLREKVLMHLAFVALIFAYGGIILIETPKENIEIDKKRGLNNLNAIYSPSPSNTENINLSAPGGNMVKGFVHFYKGEYSPTVFHLKHELNLLPDKKMKTALHNTIGISLAALGNHKEATRFFKMAYSESGNIHIGYNLAKAMHEEKMTDEAVAFEKELLKTAGAVVLSYPYVEYPNMFKSWEYLSSGKISSYFKEWVSFFVFILTMLFFYILLLLIRINYLKGVYLTRCPECGIVMCSKCNACGQHTCVVCKLMKTEPDLFAKGEKEKYETRRDRFFTRYSIYLSLFNLICPGGGLIFSNRIIEGIAYLFAIVFFIVLLFSGNTELIFNINPSNGDAIKFLLIAATAIIYLISIVRGFFASRGE
ncbi:MAG: tetratricopeptide repeat protein [bacterium]